MNDITLEELKKEIISQYHKKGFKNCIGSVEKVVDQLFDNTIPEQVFFYGHIQTKEEAQIVEKLRNAYKDGTKVA